MNKEIFENAKRLRLAYLKDNSSTVIAEAVDSKPSYEDFISNILKLELIDRENKSIKYSKKNKFIYK